MMNTIRVVYNGFDTSLCEQMEFYGLDYINFLRMLIMSCNQNLYSIGLVESWLKQHDSFYNHSELVTIMRQIAQIVSFTVRPWTKPKTMLRCHVEHLDVNKMVIVYEC